MLVGETLLCTINWDWNPIESEKVVFMYLITMLFILNIITYSSHISLVCFAYTLSSSISFTSSL